MEAEARRGRVGRSHKVASAAFRLGGLFLVWAAVWAVERALAGGGAWWGPLHAFMIGTVLLAISGATQLFSITWAAAVPTDPRIAAAQRWTLAVGAVAAILGIHRGVTWMTVLGATLVALAIAGLGWILVRIVRRSLLRRFDLATRFYLLAAASGLLGVALGGVLGVNRAGSAYLDVRTAHLHLNLVGIVGFTILGTLPTLLPTTVRHRMVSGREAVVGFWCCAVAFGLFASGGYLGPMAVGVGCAFAAVAAVLILGGIVIRLGVSRVISGGFAALLIATGSIWLTGWLGYQAFSLIGDGHRIYARATAVGVAGVGLVLFGSLAYLVPVLAGAAGERLTANFNRMAGHGAVRVIVANLVAVLLALGAPPNWAIVLAGLFLVDFAGRVGRVLVLGRQQRAPA